MNTSSDTPRKSSTKWITGIATAASAVSAQGAFVQIDLINNHVTASGGNSLNNELTGQRGPATIGGGTHPSTAGGGDIILSNIGFTSNPMSAPMPPATFSGLVRAEGSNFEFLARSVFPGPGQAPIHDTEGKGLPTTGLVVIPAIGNQSGSVSGYIPITFNAVPIHGGLSSQNGWVHVTAGGSGGALANPGDPSSARGVTLNALYWNDNPFQLTTLQALVDTIGNNNVTLLGSTEDGVFTPVPEPSGISLLALGAGGIALRRNRKQKKA